MKEYRPLLSQTECQIIDSMLESYGKILETSNLLVPDRAKLVIQQEIAHVKAIRKNFLLALGTTSLELQEGLESDGRA